MKRLQGAWRPEVLARGCGFRAAVPQPPERCGQPLADFLSRRGSNHLGLCCPTVSVAVTQLSTVAGKKPSAIIQMNGRVCVLIKLY